MSQFVDMLGAKGWIFATMKLSSSPEIRQECQFLLLINPRLRFIVIENAEQEVRSNERANGENDFPFLCRDRLNLNSVWRHVFLLQDFVFVCKVSIQGIAIYLFMLATAFCSL